MNNEKAKKALRIGIFTLGVIISTSAIGLYAVDKTFNHASGPCPITSLTHNFSHQIGILEADGWRVEVGVEPKTIEYRLITSNGETNAYKTQEGISEVPAYRTQPVNKANSNAGLPVLNISKQYNQGYTIAKTIKMHK